VGDDGLRQFVLEDADSVQITDPDLRARVQRAVEASRRDANLATRHLTIRVKGTGKRTVAVGYVAGAPLWKATYRMMLGSAASPGARLQGWATLENQSGTDWHGVTLTLQYGNPVTFRQSLYRSYFVQRPEVPVEVLGRVLPEVDTRPMNAPAAAMAPPPGRMGFNAAPMPAPAPAPEPVVAAPAEAALTEQTAEETTFTLSQPVDLQAGHSANVPIIDREFPAPRIGLVAFQQTHPFAAVRLRNDSTQSLPAGVLTVYDQEGGTSFAGDARLGGLPSGETRLVSFAQDLRTSVDTKISEAPNTFIAFSVADGVLNYTLRSRELIRITVAAPAGESRDLLLEIPRTAADESLTMEDGADKLVEQTATAYRLAVSLAAGESRIVIARIDRPLHESVTLTDGDDTIIQSIVGEDKLNAAGRTALGYVLNLRRDAARTAGAVEKQQKLLDDVEQDEDRIRKNLAAIATGDQLHLRLTDALDTDETRIEQLRKAVNDARAEADKARAVLADAVATLHI
jgi:hypothetical protein